MPLEQNGNPCVLLTHKNYLKTISFSPTHFDSESLLPNFNKYTSSQISNTIQINLQHLPHTLISISNPFHQILVSLISNTLHNPSLARIPISPNTYLQKTERPILSSRSQTYRKQSSKLLFFL